MKLALLIWALLLPQIDSDHKIESQREKWLDLYNTEVRKIRVIARENEKELPRRKQSLLNWRNEVRYGDTNGSVYVWTQNGRVAVVGTVFSHALRNPPTQRTVARSLLKLCKDDVYAQADGQVFWEPTNVGLLRAQTLDDVPVSGSRVARLGMMRRIASNFSAEIVETDGIKRKLRLIKTPIYRYEESEKSTAVDGGLFVFATEGTDPEVMLLVEALETPEGRQWQYAVGRFAKVLVRVARNGDEIWAPARDTTGSNYTTNRYMRMPEQL